MSHIEQIPPYLTWKIRHTVMYPDLDFEKAILPNDEEGLHLGLFDDNKLITVVSLFRTGDTMQFRKICHSLRISTQRLRNGNSSLSFRVF